MEFQLIPVIDHMLELYRTPPGPQRFHAYLTLLHGDTNDLSLPLGGYNPMAKEEGIQRLRDLHSRNAEQVARETLVALNVAVANRHPGKLIRLAINLCDDVQGGWTNRYTSDYDSKFKINALLNRDFCTPVFWTSESFTKASIRQRVLEYAWRTVYRQSKEAPLTLQEHLAQEAFVMKHFPAPESQSLANAEKLYQHYKHTDDYHTIFNFLYGSRASASLEFPVRFPQDEMAGFRYAAFMGKG